MGFYAYFLAGILGGLLGGMGMGGGTALIPLLVLFLGTAQRTAQGINLLAFLPMSLIALSVHAKRGLVRPKEALKISLPALLTSVLFSLLAGWLPEVVLRLFFGVFLITLAIFRFKGVFFTKNGQNR